jgi:hypothetical protein
MATTTLIFENIIIGVFTWSWVVALLFRFGAITSVHLPHLLSGLKDYPAPLGVALIIIVYPVGSMMNTLCYLLARKIFSRHQERRILRQYGLGTEDFLPVEAFVAQHGVGQLYDGVLSFRPFMRISRAAVVHSLLLACALFTFGSLLFPWAFLSLGVFAVSIPACLYSYRFWIEETVVAYAVLSHRLPETARTFSDQKAEEILDISAQSKERTRRARTPRQELRASSDEAQTG